LRYFHRYKYFLSAFRLFALDTNLDKCGSKLVCPHFSFRSRVFLLIPRQHFHVLLDREKTIFDRPLLYQSEQHSADVCLPGNFIVFLEDLKSQEAVAFVVEFDNHWVYQAKKLSVYFTQSDEVSVYQIL